MANILVTGAGGQVGQALYALAPHRPEHEFLFTTRSELDITRLNTLYRFFDRNPVDYCINCAAYTAVDRAESEPERARVVNVNGAAHLAKACRKHGTVLLHLSSDYVYHNSVDRPLRETDPTYPKSVYGWTKLQGDQEAIALHAATLVIRTSWVYAPHGHNFVRTMLRLGRERSQLRVVCDQVGTPTYAPDLAAALLQMIGRLEQEESPAALGGVYHFSNEGVCSWYDFAHAIFNLAGITCELEPIPSIEFPTPALRPHYSVLNKEKVKSTFELRIPHWCESLKRCIEILQEDKE